VRRRRLDDLNQALLVHLVDVDGVVELLPLGEAELSVRLHFMPSAFLVVLRHLQAVGGPTVIGDVEDGAD